MSSIEFYERYRVNIDPTAHTALCARMNTILLSGSNVQLRRLVLDLVKDAFPLSFLYLEIIAPVLLEITEEWHHGQRPLSEVSTAWSQAESLLPLLSHSRLEETPRYKPAILVCCVEGNYHAFGTRMLVDLLNEANYATSYLAPPIERTNIVYQCQQHPPACTAFSVSLQSHLLELDDTIDALHDHGYAGKIAAGGSLFYDGQPSGWSARGVDWVGTDPLAFIDWLDRHFTASGEGQSAA